MITDRIGLHSVPLPILTELELLVWGKECCFTYSSYVRCRLGTLCCFPYNSFRVHKEQGCCIFAHACVLKVHMIYCRHSRLTTRPSSHPLKELGELIRKRNMKNEGILVFMVLTRLPTFKLNICFSVSQKVLYTIAVEFQQTWTTWYIAELGLDISSKQRAVTATILGDWVWARPPSCHEPVTTSLVARGPITPRGVVPVNWNTRQWCSLN